jgi:hypothetical protein
MNAMGINYSVRWAYRLLKDVQVAVSDHSNRNASGSGGQEYGGNTYGK